jgi:hypothetical protein
MRCSIDPGTGLTAQQERFACELGAGKNQSEAYLAAYPRSARWTAKTVWEKASRLAANGKVQARVAGLQAALREEAERKLVFGLAEAFAMADDAFACARAFEQAGAMVAAAHLKAKIAGLIVNKHEIKRSPLDALSPDAVRVLERALSTAVGVPKLSVCEREPLTVVVDTEGLPSSRS